MTVPGCDIAWQKPTGAQLVAAGLRFACLYVGQDDTGKNMTPAVVADYAAHDVWIVTNFEYGAQQMLGGAGQGAADAALGWSQARACGMPAGRPIIYSADWPATSAQITGSVIPYLVAARGVTGPGTVGVYGSYAVVTAVAAYWAAHFPGEPVFLWQTVAWSNSRWDSADEITQTGGTVTVGGIALDQDFAASADFGQWQPGRLPDIAGADMDANQANQLAQIYNAVFPGGPSMGQNAPGEPNNGIAATLDFLTRQAQAQSALSGKVDALAAQVKALAAPSIDPAALTQAVKAALADPAVLKALAHAGAVELHDDTPAS